MALVTRRCPNADICVEGKSLLKSGHYVVRCRANNGQAIACNVAYDMCLSRSGSDFGAACNLCKGSYGNGKIDETAAGWTRCKYSKKVYGW